MAEKDLLVTQDTLPLPALLVILFYYYDPVTGIIIEL